MALSGSILSYLLIAALLALVGYGILRGLAELLIRIVPANPEFEATTDDAIDSSMQALLAEYEAVGFSRVNPPFIMNSRAPAVVVGLVDSAGVAFATVYRFKMMGSPQVCSNDIVSELAAPKIGVGSPGVMTANSTDGDSSIPDAGCFRLFVPGASVAELYDAHLAALEFLQSHGIRTIPHRADGFYEAFWSGIREGRMRMQRAPVRTLLRGVCRALVKYSPHARPLPEQRHARRTIERLRRAMGEQPLA